MDIPYSNIADTKTTKHAAPGKNLAKYRWIIVLFLIPVFYVAAMSLVKGADFLKIFTGVILYNGAVTYYLMKDYKRRGRIPNYILYIDVVALPMLVYMFGAKHADIYLVYFFIIALYASTNILLKSIKFSLGISVVYTLSCTIYGEIHEKSWILSHNIIDVFVRDIAILVVTYAIGLLIIEVRRVDQLHRMEYSKARTDKLTGLPNRHYMEQKLMEEVEDCDARGKVLNVLMFDLDNFKKFNDTYGHLWGDELLKKFSDILGQSIRKADLPVRYGGEEFIVLVKDIDFATAKSVGDRVRRQLEKEKVTIEDAEGVKRVSVSCGVAQYPTHSKDINEVIKMADTALYCAKQNGKNMVVGYDELALIEQLIEIESNKA